MRQPFKKVFKPGKTSKEIICRLLGISRMGLYKKKKKEQQQQKIEAKIINNEIKRIKKDQPRIGTRKLQVLLQAELEKHGIKIGRDGIFDLLREFGLLVKMKRYKYYTTDSKHAFYKYPNKLKGITATAPNQLWVSDITYIEIA